MLLILVLTGAVYWPGLSGGFLFDDTINITENPKVLIQGMSWQELQRAAFSFGGGGLSRPISMLSLGVNHALTGLDPFYFKLTNLVIHLLCGVGLWLLTRLLLSAYRIRHQPNLTDNEIEWIAVAASAVWLLHPFNLTSVLYIVQRMTSLAALFTIVGLVLYSWGRLRQLRGQSGAVPIAAGVLACGALGALSKENGILLPLLVLVTEWIIFGFQAPTTSIRRFVIGFIIATAIIPGLLAFGYLITNFDRILGDYKFREFTLSERLLTQARVLWFYIHMILLPNPTRMGLYHDDIALSKGWLEPFTTLPALAGIVTLLLSVIMLRRRAPLLVFGLLFFVAGHVLESTVLSLEIAHEHRNYLPAYGLLLTCIYYLGHRTVRERFSLYPQIALIVCLGLLLTFGTAIRASYWANDVDMALVEVRHHPKSARTNMQAGYIFFQLAERSFDPELNIKRARQHFQIAHNLSDYNLSGSFALLIIDDREKHPIDTVMLDELANKLANRPLSPASINALIRLSRCQNDGPCQFQPEILNRLFQAILRNSNLPKKSRAQLLTELSQFAISQNELGIALYVTQQALAVDPNNPQIHLNRAHLLINIGEFKTAHQAIERVRALDHDGFLATRIQVQERLLEQKTADFSAVPSVLTDPANIDK